MLKCTKNKFVGLFLIVLGVLPTVRLYSQDSIVIKIETLSKPQWLLPSLPTDMVWDRLVGAEAKIEAYDKILFDSQIIAMGEAPDTLAYLGFHPFLQGMYEAYSQHRPFVLSPDMINLLICQAFSKHVNVNSEALRDKFTKSPDKIALTVVSEADLLRDSVDWSVLFDGFAEQIANHAGKKLVDAMTNNFSTTQQAERIASQITLMDATKSYFDFYVIYAVCGIPEVTLLGTTEDWKKVYDRLSVYDQYGLKWWTRELRPILKKIIATTRGKKNVAFWRNMFKVHKTKRYGDMGAADGWILKFFPYDIDGNRLSMQRLKIMDINQMPHEMARVDVIYQTMGDSGALVKEIPLEAWAGFVGMEQNKDNFTVKPIISWMVRKKDLDNKALISKIQSMNTPRSLIYRDNLSLVKLTEVPTVLKNFDVLFSMCLYFKDKVYIPEWMRDIEICYLNINGKITKEEMEKILQWFPNTSITINEKSCQKGIYNYKYLTIYPENSKNESYHELPELLKMEKIWGLYIENFCNFKDNKELILPEPLQKVEIRYMDIFYPISDKSLQRIKEQFPNTVIYVDGKLVER